MKGPWGRLIGWPIATIATLAVLVSVISGDGLHVVAAVVSLTLVLPPGAVALVLVRRPSASPYGRVAVVVLASLLRLLLGFGGGVAAYALLRPLIGWGPLSFWGWLLGTYLLSLAVETAVLAGYVSRQQQGGSVPATEAPIGVRSGDLVQAASSR